MKIVERLLLQEHLQTNKRILVFGRRECDIVFPFFKEENVGTMVQLSSG